MSSETLGGCLQAAITLEEYTMMAVIWMVLMSFVDRHQTYKAMVELWVLDGTH